jgi:hypothetical protein
MIATQIIIFITQIVILKNMNNLNYKRNNNIYNTLLY